MDETQISSGSSGAASSESVTDSVLPGEIETEEGLGFDVPFMYVEIIEEPVNWLEVPFSEYKVSDGVLTLILVLLFLGGVLSLVRRFI